MRFVRGSGDVDVTIRLQKSLKERFQVAVNRLDGKRGVCDNTGFNRQPLHSGCFITGRIPAQHRRKEVTESSYVHRDDVNGSEYMKIERSWRDAKQTYFGGLSDQNYDDEQYGRMENTDKRLTAWNERVEDVSSEEGDDGLFTAGRDVVEKTRPTFEIDEVSDDEENDMDCEALYVKFMERTNDMLREMGDLGMREKGEENVNEPVRKGTDAQISDRLAAFKSRAAAAIACDSNE